MFYLNLLFHIVNKQKCFNDDIMNSEVDLLLISKEKRNPFFPL